MDEEEARERAKAEFGSRVGWRSNEWQVSGPVVEDVHGLVGVKPHLIFTFTPSNEGESRNRFPSRIAVDPETGDADMLR